MRNCSDVLMNVRLKIQVDVCKSLNVEGLIR